jgi:hypothetical protein
LDGPNVNAGPPVVVRVSTRVIDFGAATKASGREGEQMEPHEGHPFKKGSPALLAAAMLTQTIVAEKDKVQGEGAVMAIFWGCYDDIKKGLKERRDAEKKDVPLIPPPEKRPNDTRLP